MSVRSSSSGHIVCFGFSTQMISTQQAGCPWFRFGDIAPDKGNKLSTDIMVA